MSGTFSAQVADWARETEGVLEAIWKESAQRVIEDMLTPGPSAASTKASIKKGLGAVGRGKKRLPIQGPVAAAGGGGHMPVDTGFLRASLLASTSAMPVMSRRGAEGKSYAYDNGQVNLVIAGAELGQTIYAGFTAVYARKVNYSGYLFVELAAQKWSETVKAVEQELATRAGLQ